MPWTVIAALVIIGSTTLLLAVTVGWLVWLIRHPDN